MNPQKQDSRYLRMRSGCWPCWNPSGATVRSRVESSLVVSRGSGHSNAKAEGMMAEMAESTTGLVLAGVIANRASHAVDSSLCGVLCSVVRLDRILLVFFQRLDDD